MERKEERMKKKKGERERGRGKGREEGRKGERKGRRKEERKGDVGDKNWQRVIPLGIEAGTLSVLDLCDNLYTM